MCREGGGHNWRQKFKGVCVFVCLWGGREGKKAKECACRSVSEMEGVGEQVCKRCVCACVCKVCVLSGTERQTGGATSNHQHHFVFVYVRVCMCACEVCVCVKCACYVWNRERKTDERRIPLLPPLSTRARVCVCVCVCACVCVCMFGEGFKLQGFLAGEGGRGFGFACVFVVKVSLSCQCSSPISHTVCVTHCISAKLFADPVSSMDAARCSSWNACAWRTSSRHVAEEIISCGRVNAVGTARRTSLVRRSCRSVSHYRPTARVYAPLYRPAARVTSS